MEILQGPDNWGENGNAANNMPDQKTAEILTKICYPFHSQPTIEPQVNKYVEDFIKPPSIFSTSNYINYGFSS